MDMAFLRRAEQLLGDRSPVRLDHALLMAALAAHRTASAASRVGGEAATRRSGDTPDDPLTELLLAGPGWRRAASRQGGCFSRAEAGRRLNVP
ncbi:hypothetical protein [Sphingosinicella sp. CPCC 101087]|uniref:hypothetical protein n=1 Tax=Sphingosinicella sp. CPCC 101087 TaxID=2497754 RepID=UPI00101C7AFA|nr:hypothetical protein [Sphingosinicella sp. CPCC 101087]